MDCPREITAIQVMAGELSHDEVQEWRSHALHCPVCAHAFEETEYCWNALSEWGTDVSDVDLTDRIMSGAGVFSYGEPKKDGARSMGMMSVFRIAASLLIGAGLGVAAGRLAPLSKSDPLGGNSSLQAEKLPSWESGVETFAIESATGLGTGLAPVQELGQGELP